MDKSRVKGILLNYLNDYYAEYPEELDSGEIANWGELDSYYEDYPEIFQKLVNGEPDDPEVEELWNFAEKVWDAWTTFAKSSNALDESTTNKFSLLFTSITTKLEFVLPTGPILLYLAEIFLANPVSLIPIK